MKHELHLRKNPFQKIYDGNKTIELRLYDEKRKNILVGDEIRFIYEKNSHIWMEVKVVALHCFSSFKELYKSLPLEKCGYKKDTLSSASYHDMEQYYPKELQKQYGVVGIEFELLPGKKPFRAPFRMENFLEQFELQLKKYWKKHPDYRFGQILTIAQYAFQNKGYRDFFYIEDEKFLELWEDFIREEMGE